MRIKECERALREMLRAAGVDRSRPTPAAVWPVFKEFCRRPVETASDGILVETGGFSFDGAKHFHLTFTRQFEVLRRDGDHAYYEQLQAEFQFQLSSDLEALGGSSARWFAGEDGPLDDYFAAIERSPGFVEVVDQAPASFRVRQERV